MNEETEKEKPLQIDREAYWAENGRLYLEGPKSREIAMKLGQPGLNVGRNLREIKKRWARAATRQDAVLNQTQCATVYCEAMGGWQWSQNPKTTTTEENKIGDKSGESARSVIRSEQGPGDKTFLTTAVGALKALRRFAAEPKAATPAGDDRSFVNAVLVDLLHIMTQEQANNLTHEQVQRFRQAIDARRKELQQRRLEAEARRAGEECDGDRETAGLPGADQLTS